MDADSERLNLLDEVSGDRQVILLKIDGLRDNNKFTVIDKNGRVGDYPDVRTAIDALIQRAH